MLVQQTSVAYDHISMTYTQAPVPVQQTGEAYDYPSMTFTHAPVPVQFTVQPSSIPGASLGVFSTTSTEKGVCIDPNEGDKVSISRDSTTWHMHGRCTLLLVNVLPSVIVK